MSSAEPTEVTEETSVTESSTRTENKTLSENGDTETAVVVKLPTKKSAAKTETKVEVVQKSLPDGSVQEIKTTTTRTTIDGKTEISTKTETKTISKEETDEEIYEEEEEECEAENVKTITSNNQSKENGTAKETKQQNGEIIKQEEKSETSTTTTKKVVVIQSDAQESEEEAEEVEEEEEVEVEEEDEDEALVVEEVVVLKKEASTKSVSNDLEDKNSEVEKSSTKENISSQESEKEDKNQSEEECEIEEEDDEVKESDSKDKDLSEDEDEKKESSEKDEADEVENEDDETEEQNLVVDEKEATTDTTNVTEESTTTSDIKKVDETVKSEAKSEEVIIPIQTEARPNEKIRTEVLREPTVPLEKVEEVEIKPIGAPAQEIITKSHKEIISTTTDKPSALSTQTEYNVIENIVTVNRTTKTLDHAYEQAGEYTVPVVKTSLIPDNSGTLPPPPPIFNRTYQTSYSQEPTTERRHSLLLERLSVERQLPTSNIYQTDNTYTNNAYDSRQLYGEPQSEIVIENNVKPSMVNKNQQWYSKKDNYDYASTGSSIPSQQWNQPQSQPQSQYQPQVQSQYQTQLQTQYQPQPQYQSQPQYQPQTQTQYQSQYEYTPQSQSYSQSINLQSQYTSPQSQQNSYNESYKSSIQNNYSQNSYSSYTPKPSWVNSTADPKPTSLSNQYSYESDSYQKSTQNQTSYVPPPWEQDSGYANNFTQNTYQPQTPTTPLPKPTPSWKAPNAKFPKATSYVPPAPNQSFVKPVSAADQPRMSGRKTYYSEYERRYITVPESTYIPTETKFQAQPDPSPQYYYDQNEPVETVEPQWRKELREFTEKTQTSSYTDSSVRPPWEEEPKYVSEQTNTRTWSQTLRPRSFRERSVETDYNSTAKEWSKSNSLGRGRPQSSYVNNLKRIPERTRGVSVDRYNPNVYQSPVMGEHPPVQSQTLDPAIHPKPHYNPNVPAYHSRASAEPREQTYTQPKWDSRAPPVQSRSFKYLQWITGTED